MVNLPTRGLRPRWMQALLLAPLLLLGALRSSAAGTEFFVAPGGSSGGDGSQGRPWDLATGLGQPSGVQPGDTIWLRGGRYAFPRNGNILCGLRGTEAAPITVAQYPGERATLDIKGAAQGLFFTTAPHPRGAAWVNFKDFEVTNSETRRVPGMPVAIYVRTSDHLKFINLVVHDTGEAFALAPEATNTEVYGNLVYGNGALSGLEHGIYIQNVAGYKKAIDNVIFGNAGFGIHAFPHRDDSSLANVSVVGNISFDNGLLGDFPPQPDLLVGGDAVAVSPVISDNATYKPNPPVTLWNQQFGLVAGCRSPRVTNNYFVGTTVFTACTQGLAMTGNTFHGKIGIISSSKEAGEGVTGRVLRWMGRLGIGSGLPGLDEDAYPNNHYQGQDSRNRILLRPNQYDPSRTTVAVYNWDRSAAVDLDPRPLLRPGDRYELRSVEDYFGHPVLSGSYGGGSLRIPMTEGRAAAGTGLQPRASDIEFRTFVLFRLGAAR